MSQLRDPWKRLSYLLALLLLPVSLAAQMRPEFSAVHIGAFDPDAWNGIMFESKAYGQRISFAIRFGSKFDTFVDGDRIFHAISLVGPHAPDGSYSLIGWRNRPRATTITLEWSRINETTVVGRLTAPRDVQLVLEAYGLGGPGDFAGTYGVRAAEGLIDGEHFIDGEFGKSVRFVVAVDRPMVGAGLFSDVHQLQGMMNVGQLASVLQKNREAGGGRPAFDNKSPHGAAGLEFTTSVTSTAHFVATIGWNSAQLSKYAHQMLASGQIDAVLARNAASYAAHRPHIEGLFAGSAEAIGNSMFWNSLYVPSLGLEFPSISRNWAHGFGGWVVGEWDCFFGSLLTDIEDPRQTSAAVRAILLAQAPNGVVPNVDAADGTSPDRSQPPVGAYIVLKNYERDGDLQTLRWAYPRLKKWHQTDEQYYAWGGSAGGDTHYTWGALLCLIPMEQFIDENPWDGLRFGALQPPGTARLVDVTWKRHRYDVTIGSTLTSVVRDGAMRFEANAGVIVRNYSITPDSLSFSIKTARDTQISTMETRSGSVSLVINGGAAHHVPVRNGAVVFTVPAGSHSISETWSDR